MKPSEVSSSTPTASSNSGLVAHLRERKGAEDEANVPPGIHWRPIRSIGNSLKVERYGDSMHQKRKRRAHPVSGSETSGPGTESRVAARTQLYK